MRSTRRPTSSRPSRGADIRAVTRNPLAAGLPAHVEVVEGDPSRPDTVAPFLEGVTALFLHPRTVGTPAVELLALAPEQGMKRVVTLSAMNVDDNLDEQPCRYRGDRNKEVEDAAAGSGLEWVSLRASTFAINTLGAWGAQIRAGDVLQGPYATFAEAPIHERDLAGVAARALFTDEQVGRRAEDWSSPARSPSPTRRWSPPSATRSAGACATRRSRRRRPSGAWSSTGSPSHSSRR
jgi:uncharacterized protein YbjT (DUF2867 family)